MARNGETHQPYQDYPAELRISFEALDAMSRARGALAWQAARHVIEVCNGRTTDPNLFYLAMHGLTPNDRAAQTDSGSKDFDRLQRLRRALADPAQQGAPFFVHYNDTAPNAEVGLIDSFVAGSIQPIEYRIHETTPQPAGGQASTLTRIWHGSLVVALRKIVVANDGHELTAPAFQFAETVEPLALEAITSRLDFAAESAQPTAFRAHQGSAYRGPYALGWDSYYLERIDEITDPTRREQLAWLNLQRSLLQSGD